MCALLLVGCAPSLDQLYRDFAVPTRGFDDTSERVATSLREAGWTLSATDVAISTDRRTHRRWGLYRVTASVEVIVLGDKHVRVFIHPFREYVWGRESKMPYLTRPVRDAFVPDLVRSFTEQGFEMVTFD